MKKVVFILALSGLAFSIAVAQNNVKRPTVVAQPIKPTKAPEEGPGKVDDKKTKADQIKPIGKETDNTQEKKSAPKAGGNK